MFHARFTIAAKLSARNPLETCDAERGEKVIPIDFLGELRD